MRRETVKNHSVGRQVVSDAIHWLIENNPHYSDIELHYHALNSLFIKPKTLKIVLTRIS